MRTMKLGVSDLQVPAVAVGCWRIDKISGQEAERFVQAAMDLDAVFFDHADVYGQGKCEELFAKAIHMSDSVREKIFLQSKCGIRGGMYDFSREHILSAVDGSLKRLQTDYLDVLLLHRPDALMEPEEVAEAFDRLHAGGKVRHFGVSNQNPMQIQLLQKYVKQPLVANQLQLSAAHAGMIAEGIHVNVEDGEAVVRTSGILDFCRLHDITVQAWSPFQFGMIEGVFLDNDNYLDLNVTLDEIGRKYGVSDTTIALAWILRHPARIQPVTGTMNMGRLKDCVAATDITLTREEWYAIYRAAGYTVP